MRRVRWGIAGCGWVARDFAGRAIAGSCNGELAALHDVSAEALAAAARLYPAAVAFADLAAFLTSIDVVYVATPNHAHRTLVEAAAAAGVAVLCEKPMAATIEDARAMVEACARHGVVYATAFDQRFHPAHTHLAQLIAQGDLGRVFAVRIAYCCWVDRGFAGDNWRIDPARAGGGALIDLAPHGLDLLGVLLGEAVDEVAAFGQSRVQDYDVEDGAMIIARTRSGVLAQLHVAYNCPETYPRRRLEVLGTAAQIVATDTMGQTAGGSLVRTDATTGEQHFVDIVGLDRSPFLLQMEAFAESLLSGRPFPYTPAHDLHIMGLVASAQRQAGQGLRDAA